MPGLAIQLSGAAFAPANILIPGLPAVGTTVLWTYIGRNLASSQNLMPGAPAITAIGAPVFPASNNYATLTAANYLDTGLLDDSKSFTLLCAVRLGQTTGVAITMAFQGTTADGFYSQYNNGLGLSQTRVYGNGVTLANFSVAGATLGFKLFAYSYNDTTTRMDIYNLTDNTTVGITGTLATRISAAAGAHVLLGNDNIQFASTAPLDMAFAGKVNGAAWTQAQCQQALLNIRQTLAGVGITV